NDRKSFSSTFTYNKSSLEPIMMVYSPIKPSCNISILYCKNFTYVSTSEPFSTISSEYNSPNISTPDSAATVSIGRVSTFVSTNKTGGSCSLINASNDLICSGEPFSSVSIAQINPSSSPYRFVIY